MAEFAIVAPVFLLLVIGIMMFGRALFYWIEANHEASETARWAVVDRNPYDDAPTCTGAPNGSDGCQTLQQHAAGASTSTREFSSNVAVCIDFPGTSESAATEGDRVRVRVQKPFSIFNLWSIPINGTATMRIERFESGDDPVNYTAADDIGTCS
jgi:Flp pilus assembly protein TadG